MKKLLVLILALAMVLMAFTACGGDTENQDADNPAEQVGQNTDDGQNGDADAVQDSQSQGEADGENDQEKDNENNKVSESTGTTSSESGNTGSSANGSSGSGSGSSGSSGNAGGSGSGSSGSDKNDADKNEAKPAPSGTPSEIIEKIYAEKAVELPLVTSEIDLDGGEMFTAMTGLASNDKIKAAACSESMMGSQAYSLVVVRVKNSKDAAAVADEMLNGIDPRKWVCVEADDVRVAAYDDLVMLFMVGSQYKETVTGKEMVAAFKKVCGGNLDVSKKR